ncbi:flagellar motor stator protein MotA [Solidesulfovibrio magneticus]|uniref:Chemotaxis protein MotA n=1 Tax=Solidesulfovibrio magneticus (strain ATCC 700980 / DSM 13731 / RS-1) TaxID=573370 RepID=C4XNU0_SOLM1|nr:flagellar motor stator protein MotA [Solidesulfovibrio magneticus]BAH75058.1 chemotaxis protein MotA [Solidesulfovibrio magneticus RS-1]
MIVMVGLLVVIASVCLGYLMEGGVFAVLVQPAEWVIIIGAALGAMLVGSTRNALTLIVKGLPKALFPAHIGRDHYLEALACLARLLGKIRREGLMSIEGDIEHPETSPIFAKATLLSKDKAALAFICDTMRVYLVSGDAQELEQLMDLDLAAIHLQASSPAHNLGKVAESLPGLGIVAAVLGVVLTMGKISQPPEVLGHSIGAALVGTFLGVLLCYGFVGPLAGNLENQAMERQTYFSVIRAVIAGAARGATPLIAVEYGRRAIPEALRPNFADLEGQLKG